MHAHVKYINTYIHTDIHTYMHAYIHAYAHTYVTSATCLVSRLQKSTALLILSAIAMVPHSMLAGSDQSVAYVSGVYRQLVAHMHAHVKYVNTYIHTDIHTYMHACIHAYAHTYVTSATCLVSRLHKSTALLILSAIAMVPHSMLAGSDQSVAYDS